MEVQRRNNFVVKWLLIALFPHRWGILLFTPPPGVCWPVAGLSWGGWWVRVRVRVSGGVVGEFLAVG